MWTNFVILTLLKSCSGVFELCTYEENMSGLKSVVQTLCINNQKIRVCLSHAQVLYMVVYSFLLLIFMIFQKAILELLCELLSIPQPEWTDDENIALESIQFSQHRESFKLSEGFLVSEGKLVMPNFSKTRLVFLIIFCTLQVCLDEW